MVRTNHILWAIVCFKLLLIRSAFGETLSLQQGQRIAVVGNALAERMNLFGYFEADLHQRFPALEIQFRNFGWPADEVGLQQRPNNYTALDDPIEVFGPDLMICFFGFNESFAGTDEATLEKFTADYRDYLTKQEERFEGVRFVLVSPIAFESTDNPLHPDGAEHNRRLSKYTTEIERLAKLDGHAFANVFEPSKSLFAQQAGAQFTINGFHLNDAGYERMANWLQESLLGNVAPKAELQGRSVSYAKLFNAVNDKSWYHLQDYRMLNGWYVYGGRRTWDKETFPGEYQKIRRMVAVRDEYVWDIAAGREVPPEPDDSQTGDVVIPATMFGTRDENFRRFREPKTLVFPTPEQSIAQMKVPDGMEVRLFADEKRFPELANPCQLEFDDRGRLWVSCMANYPQWRPDLDKPDDRLLIFEDTDGDGEADKCIPFYDKLSCPTGFEFYNGGVLVIDQPRIIFLKDTDGDDRADLVEHVIDGIATGDTHHSMGAWEISHDGLIYMLEGIAVSTTLETPHGPLRNNGPSGAYIWDPLTQRIRHFRTPGHGNPWCMVFDEWNAGIVGDGTGAAQHWASPLSGAPVATRKTMRTVFDSEGMRPVVGSEYLRSRHLPENMHDQFIYACVINMHGLTRFEIGDDTSTCGLTGHRIEDLLDSTDMMFRPVDPHVGPDGAIWFGDWCNPLIGHMQYSQRDPNRDHDHGRIYRLINTRLPLIEPETQRDQPLEVLLGQLNAFEWRTRCRARRALRDREKHAVLSVLDEWVQEQTTSRALCEAMWLKASFRSFDRALIDRILQSEDFHSRAAAVHVVANHFRLIDGARGILASAVHDPHGRVRLEAVRGLSFFPDAKAAEEAMQIVNYEMDYWTSYALEQTLNALTTPIGRALQTGTFLAGADQNIREYFDAFLKEQSPGLAVLVPLSTATNEDASIEEREAAIDKLSAIPGGNVNRGRVVYQRVCATCHVIGDMGKNFGPDMHDVGARLTRRDLVESIVHPNKEISEGYRTVTVADENGEIVNGFVVSESDRDLQLRVEGGEIRNFVKELLEDRVERNSSSMPEGLANTIAPTELLDLLRFLHVQRKTKDGFFRSRMNGQAQRQGDLLEVSHGAEIQLGPDSPQGLNLDADLFLATGHNTDFTVHSAEPSKTAYATVRLPKMSKIHRVWIENRRNSQFHNRAKTLAVWISKDGQTWKRIWQARTMDPEWTVVLTEPSNARYVRVGLQEEGILNLNRMKIYGNWSKD